MKIESIEPARKFRVGLGRQIEINHCANIMLAADEQVTFVTKSGSEYDVVRKPWGYYATPSTNGRLHSQNLRAALVTNSKGQLYVMLCETGKEGLFNTYLEEEKQQLLVWLDTDENVAQLRARLLGDR